MRVFITCGSENKAAGLTTESNLDYTESSSLLGTEKLMSRCLSQLPRSSITVFQAQTPRSGGQRTDLGAGKQRTGKSKRNQLDPNYREFMFGGNPREYERSPAGTRRLFSRPSDGSLNAHQGSQCVAEWREGLGACAAQAASCISFNTLSESK